MATVGVGTIYTLRIFKNLRGAKASGQWSNTYHFQSDSDMDGDAIKADVQLFIDAERGFHLDLVELDRAVLSTTVKGDSDTLEGLPRVFPIGQVGGVHVVSDGNDPNDCLPLEMAVKINHSAGRGRGAANYYRGCLAGNQWSNLSLAPVVSINADGTIVQALENIAQSNAFTWGVPFYTGPKGDKTLSGIRKIIEVTKGGIVGRQRTARRRKKVAALGA